MKIPFNDIISSLDEYDNDIVTKFKDESDKVANVLEPLIRDFQTNTLDDIPQNFGKFLYTALGNNINSENVSVLNNEYFKKNDDGIRLAKEAKAKKMSLEKYLLDGNIYGREQYWITTGRRFGTSHVTWRRHASLERTTRCDFFNETTTFTNLTPEHINCIKNENKKLCSQSFLDYRNEFITEYNTFKKTLIPISIPIKIGLISIMKMDSRLKTDDMSDKYRVNILKNIEDSEITHIQIKIPSIKQWDKSKGYTENCGDTNTCIAIDFLNINNNKKKITNLGNFDISTTKIAHSLNNEDKFSNSAEHTISSRYYSYRGYSIDNEHFKNYNTEATKGFIFNLGEVMSNPIIQNELKTRINFFTKYSKKLQEIKMKYADLYFINSNF